MTLYEKVDPLEEGDFVQYVGNSVMRPHDPPTIGFREVKEDDTWYTLVKDDDGHEYVIPSDKREEYEEYMEAVYAYWAPGSDKDNLELPDEPEWLIEVGGRVHFMGYRIE